MPSRSLLTPPSLPLADPWFGAHRPQHSDGGWQGNQLDKGYVLGLKNAGSLRTRARKLSSYRPTCALVPAITLPSLFLPFLCPYT